MCTGRLIKKLIKFVYIIVPRDVQDYRLVPSLLANAIDCEKQVST